MTDRIEITLANGVSDIPEADWDACANPSGTVSDPFVSHRFLTALERSGSVGQGTDWAPRPAVVRKNGTIIAVAPLYIKSHSQGEYVFDNSWAHALENAGGDYYPKLQIAVPFTPVTGRRFLTRAGYEAEGMAALIEGLVSIATENNISSIHATFCTEDEARHGEQMGLLGRTGQQFHWENDGYRSFDDFLAALSSRKRKTIRKERAEAQAFGGTVTTYTGDAILPNHWDHFWRFYQDTGSRKWGTPYLTRAFFDEVHATMRNDILLVLAEKDGRPIAGALNFIGSDTLYGRYWGCIEHHPCLHFELCYYQAIDYAIANGLRVEAGAQGEHKLARGYLPAPTHSLHWIANPSFRRAVSDFLEQERQMVDEEIDILTTYGPFRRTPTQEQD